MTTKRTLSKLAVSRPRYRVLIGLLLLGLLSACSSHAPQDFLKPRGPVAGEEGDLWNLTFWLAVAVFVIVEGLIVFALFRYRARPERQAKQFHGNTKVEIALIVLPSLLLLGIAIPTVRTIFTVAAKPTGANVLNVTVTAHQFWWQYDYPEYGFSTANELHIPTDTPVYFTLKSEDVIHSFWIPKLAGKQDVVPGHTNHLQLTATEPGLYFGQCTEYCGASHGYMRLRAYASSPADFQTWVDEQRSDAAQPSSGAAAQGAKLFLEGAKGGQFPNGPACVNCHAINGLENAGTRPGLLGPDLTHLWSRHTFAGASFSRTPANLKRWLEDPSAMKPGVLMPKLGLTPEEIDSLLAFLKTLR